MSVRVADGVVAITAQIDDSSVRRASERAGQQAGTAFSRSFTRSTDDGLDETALRRTGEDAGAAIARGAEGRLRDARGRFASAGSDAGNSFATSVTQAVNEGIDESRMRRIGEDAGDALVRGADGRLRDARGRFVGAGEDMGNAVGEGMDSGGQGQKQGGLMAGGLAAAGAAFAAAGAVVGAIFMKGFAEAMEQEESVALLSSQVGAFGDDSKRLGKVAGSLYAHGYGESFEEVTTSLKGALQNIGGLGSVSNAELEKIGSQALNVSKILGEDVGATTRAVGQMMKTGMAKNAQEAFDIIVRGAQTGGNASEDLLDTFNEYSTQFRKLGLDGKTAMGLISQGLQGGARDADIVADAFKEFSIRAIDGSKSTIEAYEAMGLPAEETAAKIAKGGVGASQGLQLVLDKLRAMKDPVERNAAAVGIFGTQAEDLGDALFKLDPSSAVKTLGEVGGAAEKAGEQLHSTFTARWEQLKRTMQQTLVDFITERVMPVINGFIKWMKEHPEIVNPVISALKTLAIVFGSLAVVGGIIAGVAAAFALLSSPVTWIIGAIAAIALGIKYLWEHSETFRTIVTNAWNRIKEAALSAVEFFKANVWPVMVQTWETLKEKAKVVADFFMGTIWPMMIEGWNILKAAVEPIVNRIKGFFDDLGGKGDGLKGIWQNVVTVVGEKLSQLWDLIQTLMTAITEIWETHKGWIIPTLTTIWSTIGSIIGTAMQLIWDIIQGVWTAISGVISAAMQVIKGVIQLVMGILTLDWSTAWEGIKNIFGGIWNAIISILKGAWEIISGLVSTLWTTIKNVFLTMWNWLVGNSLVPDLVNSIISWFTRMRDMVANLVQMLKDWVSGKFTALKDAVVLAVTVLKDRAVGIFNTFKDNVMAGATWLKDKVVGAFNTLKDGVISAFERAKDGVGRVWDMLKSIAARPVNFVIGSVYNNGIRKFWNAIAGKIGLGNLPELSTLNFQKGGTVDLRNGAALPGFSRTDDTLAMVRSGEGVLVPEAVNALGGAQFINRANRMGHGAGRLVGGNNRGKIPGFAFGGIVDAVGGFIDKGKDFFRDGFMKALNAVTGPIVTTMHSNFGSDPLLGMPTLAVKSILDNVKGFLGPRASQLEGGDGKKVVDVARSQVGHYGRPNKFTQAPGMWTDEWCGMFVDWVFKHANSFKALSAVPHTPAVNSFTNLPRVGRNDTRPGDLALYRGDTGHINIVGDPKSSESIGGNESNNSVVRSHGYMNSASSFRRPKFARGGIVESREVLAAGGLKNLQAISWQDRKESPHVSEADQARRDLFAPPPWVSRDMGGLLPDGMMAYNTSGTAEVVSTLDQLKALVAAGKGTTYIFNEGSIQLDASKIQNIEDLTRMLDNLRVTARKFGARV